MTTNDSHSGGPGQRPSADHTNHLPLIPAAQQALPGLATASMPWQDGQAADESLNVVNFFHALRRRCLVAFGLGFAVTAVVAVVLWFIIPVNYEAVALIRVRAVTQSIMSMGRRGQGIHDYETYKQTQAALIKSPYVVNAALRRPEIFNLRMVQAEENPVAWLAGEISVTNPQNSEVLRITMKGEIRDEIVKIVNAVNQAYMEEIVQADRDSLLERLDILKRTYRQNVTTIKDKQDAVYKLAEQVGTTDAHAARITQELEMERLFTFRKKRNQIELELREVETEVQMHMATEQARQVDPSEYEIEDNLAVDPQYRAAKETVLALEEQYQLVAANARPGSAGLQRVNSSLRSARAEVSRIRRQLFPRIKDRIKRARGEDEQTADRIRQELQAQLQILTSRLNEADETLVGYEESVKGMGTFSADLESRKSELGSLNRITEMVKTEIDSLELNRLSTPRIQLIQAALVPDESDKNVKYSTIGVLCFATMSLVILGIAFFDYQSKRVNTSDDVTKGTGIRMVGSLPMLTRSGWFPGRPPAAILDAVLMESIDSIRTTLLSNNLETPIDLVMVTSATGQEGKTTLSSQLAISLARSGRRTLLIDTDVYNPQLHEVFNVPLDSGFCGLLREESTLNDVVHATEVEGLWIVSAGYCDASSLRALAGAATPKLFEQVKSQFDFVVIDSGPVLAGAIPLLLGQCADTSLISVRRDISRVSKITESIDRMRSVGIHVMGAVLNGGGAEVRQTKLQLAYGSVGSENDQEAG